MNPEDLTAIEAAGRRCAVCQTGRHWRKFEVVRPEGRDPVVLCSACRARFGETPPMLESSKETSAAPEPAQTAQPDEPQEADATPKARSRKRGRPQQRSPQSEDRLKRALRELPPGEHSTARIAKAAGLNRAKVLSRLHALEEAGEVQQVGNRWSTERPSTDLEAAFDRLQARTGNLRIVRERERVG